MIVFFEEAVTGGCFFAVMWYTVKMTDEKMTDEKMIFKISVRGLVEFMLRSGSLELAGGRSDEASMAEGARIHRSRQKKEGAGYQAEVPLRIDLPVLASDPDLSVLRLAETTGGDEETGGNQEESVAAV